MTHSLPPQAPSFAMLLRNARTAMVSGILLASVLVTNQFAWAQSNQPSSRALPAGAQAIEHVIIIVQKNRSTDNLFHDPKLIAEGADIASAGMNSKGKTIRLAAITLASNYDLGHSHTSFLKMYDNGRMDGADEESVSCVPHALHCPPRNPQFKYVQASDVAPYFQMAEQFTFADHMFQTN